MKAILSKAPGPPATLVLEEIPAPSPGPGQVAIDVKACGVNYPDVLIIADKYQVKPPRPFSPGIEVSGVVASLGPATTGLRVGDRVLASLRWGGMAERVVVDASAAMVMPDSMPFDEAASLLTTFGTSLYALEDRGRLKKGETLLVLGAAGGVGLAAVELGKAFGAHVVAAASSREKVNLAVAHGADAGLVYPAGPFDQEGTKALANLFKVACGQNGWDVAYDAVGGDYCEAAVRASGWGGRYLVVGFPAGIPKLPLNLVLLKSCEIVGVSWGAMMARDAAFKASTMKALFGLHAEGKIRPYISERFPFERAADAIARLADRGAMGKVVVMLPGA